jgi:hypothetical protein
MSNFTAQDLGIFVPSVSDAAKEAAAKAAKANQEIYDSIGNATTNRITLLITSDKQDIYFNPKIGQTAEGVTRLVGDKSIPLACTILGKLQEHEGENAPIYQFDYGNVKTSSRQSFLYHDMAVVITKEEYDTINNFRKAVMENDSTVKGVLVTFEATPLSSWSDNFTTLGRVVGVAAQGLVQGATSAARSPEQVSASNERGLQRKNASGYSRKSTRTGRPPVGRPQMTVPAPQQVTETV